MKHALPIRVLQDSRANHMRIEEQTFFRFAAATIVVIFHFGREVGEFAGVLVGPEMVTALFVLSGFVMWIARQ